MGTIVKVFLFLVGLLRFLKGPNEDEKTKAAFRQAKETWEKEMERLDNECKKADAAYSYAILHGNPTHVELYAAWKLCGEQAKRHRNTGKRRNYIT